MSTITHTSKENMTFVDIKNFIQECCKEEIDDNTKIRVQISDKHLFPAGSINKIEYAFNEIVIYID